jgi:hypothetical protein
MYKSKESSYKLFRVVNVFLGYFDPPLSFFETNLTTSPHQTVNFSDTIFECFSRSIIHFLRTATANHRNALFLSACTPKKSLIAIA